MANAAPRKLRVVIFCLGIETVKHISPLRYFGADKAYMLYLEKKPLFKVFRKEVADQANRILKEPLVEAEVKVYDFAATMAKIISIIRKEKALENIVYLNLDGPPNYASAAMISAMMEDCETFYTPTQDHLITDVKMFQDNDGKLVGLAREVKDPVMVPKFQLRMPDEDIVRGLRVWKERRDKNCLMSDAKMVEALRDKGLMGKHNSEKDASQKAKMYYRRHFVEEWEYLGWMVKSGKSRYAITQKGEVAIQVFYAD
jgi:hypothetical protein